MRNAGALADFQIREEMKAGAIIGALDGNVQPASLDLQLSDEVYRLPWGFQVDAGCTVRSTLEALRAERCDIRSIFDPGPIYIIRLKEYLELSDEIYGYANPKSTTGRLDLHVRVLTDYAQEFDHVARGYKGPLWLMVRTQSFPMRLYPGNTLVQIRFMTENTKLSSSEIVSLHRHMPLVWRGGKKVAVEDLRLSEDGSIYLSVDLESRIVGWQALNSNPIVDFSKVGEHKPEDFFRPIFRSERGLVLEKGRFYILGTQEGLRIPLTHACEMRPVDERVGDHRTHYAGFFDPGFGEFESGRKFGTQGVLEVRPTEHFLVRPNQRFVRVRFERMLSIPERSYVQTGTYADQTNKKWGPRLAKHFKM